jgi:hypothetical protein
LRWKQSVVAVHKKRKGGNWYGKVPRCIKIREEKRLKKEGSDDAIPCILESQGNEKSFVGTRCD